MIVLNVSYCVYVSAAEHTVLYIAVIHDNSTQRNQLRITLQDMAGTVISWAYHEDQRVPSFADSAAKKQIKLILNFGILSTIMLSATTLSNLLRYLSMELKASTIRKRVALMA